MMKGLKLTYKLSRSTDIDSAEIKGVIMLNLKAEKYDVEATTNTGIKFDGNPGRNFFSRLQQAEIAISDSEKGSIVELKYYVNLLPPFIFFMVSLIAGITFSVYLFPLLCAILLSIQELIRISVWKDIAEKLLEDLLKI